MAQYRHNQRPINHGLNRSDLSIYLNQPSG
jgi:hypothetical protein